MPYGTSHSIRNRISVLAAAAALPALLLAGGMAHAASVPKVVNATLSDVSCKGNSFCMAAGNYSTARHKGLRLAEEWNGKDWRDVADPVSGHLFAITCGSPVFCFGAILVGPHQAGSPTKWNGRTWQVYKNTAAIGATCGSPKVCMKISGVSIDEWNGSRWKVDPSTNACDGNPPGDPCGYNGLSCGSGSNCLAMQYGCTSEACVEGPEEFSVAWDGSGWGSGSSAPDVGVLSCSGEPFCMNVAPEQASIWDSAGWQDVTPDLSALCTSADKCSLRGALSCGANQACVILPAGSPVSLVWTHLAWEVVPLATIGGKVPKLGSLSCGSATNCMAVGSYGKPSQPVAEHWNGTKWQLAKPVNH